MSTHNPQAEETARNILHDVDFLTKSKEFDRYFTQDLIKRRDENLDRMINVECWEDFCAYRGIYLELDDLIKKPERDASINQKIVDDCNRSKGR